MLDYYADKDENTIFYLSCHDCSVLKFFQITSETSPDYRPIPVINLYVLYDKINTKEMNFYLPVTIRKLQNIIIISVGLYNIILTVQKFFINNKNKSIDFFSLFRLDEYEYEK